MAIFVARPPQNGRMPPCQFHPVTGMLTASVAVLIGAEPNAILPYLCDQGILEEKGASTTGWFLGIDVLR